MFNLLYFNYPCKSHHSVTTVAAVIPLGKDYTCFFWATLTGVQASVVSGTQRKGNGHPYWCWFIQAGMGSCLRQLPRGSSFLTVVASGFWWLWIRSTGSFLVVKQDLLVWFSESSTYFVNPPHQRLSKSSNSTHQNLSAKTGCIVFCFLQVKLTDTGPTTYQELSESNRQHIVPKVLFIAEWICSTTCQDRHYSFSSAASPCVHFY